jgi:Zn-dependent M28 family amino/carboxypeptidase
MREVFLLAALVSSMVAMGQKAANPTVYANSITAEDLKKHLYIVAGKEMQGRETTTEGQRKAAAYIEEQFKNIGLLPANKGSYEMMFPVYQDSLESMAFQINGKSYEADKDFSVNISSNYSATILAKEIVFVGAGISDSLRDDYKGLNARGKVVLVLSNAPQANNTRRGSAATAVQEAAQRNGAIAVLSVQSNFPRRPVNPKGFQSLNAFKKVVLPNTFYISEQLAKDIMGADFAQAKSDGTVGKTYTADIVLDFRKSMLKAESSNVLGMIEGTSKKDEYLFITAHYDHLGQRGDTVIYYGADDDGSGTVSVIEIADAFMKAKKAGKGPARTIVFMTVSGEEKGLWGSAYYGDNPAFPLEKTTADLNIDMVGRIDPKRKEGDSTNYIYVVGDDKLSTDLRPISESINQKYSKLELDYKFNDPKDPERIYFRSDHYNFARKGVPIIFYFNGTHNDYHRPTDTPDKINYDLMEKRAKFIFYTAWEMANRPQMLKRDILLEIPQR